MPRGGRLSGAKGKKTEANRKSILSEIEVRGKKTPLEFMLELMWNTKRPLAIRLDAAKSAAPYVHRKQPMEVEASTEVEVIPVFLPKRRD